MQMRHIFESSGSTEELRNRLITLINQTEDAAVLRELIKISSKEVVEDLIKQTGLSSKDQDVLYKIVLSSSSLDFEDVLDFFDKRNKKGFHSTNLPCQFSFCTHRFLLPNF